MFKCVMGVFCIISIGIIASFGGADATAVHICFCISLCTVGFGLDEICKNIAALKSTKKKDSKDDNKTEDDWYDDP